MHFARGRQGRYRGVSTNRGPNPARSPAGLRVSRHNDGAYIGRSGHCTWLALCVRLDKRTLLSLLLIGFGVATTWRGLSLSARPRPQPASQPSRAALRTIIWVSLNLFQFPATALHCPRAVCTGSYRLSLLGERAQPTNKPGTILQAAHLPATSATAASAAAPLAPQATSSATGAIVAMGRLSAWPPALGAGPVL